MNFITKMNYTTLNIKQFDNFIVFVKKRLIFFLISYKIGSWKIRWNAESPYMYDSIFSILFIFLILLIFNLKKF